MIINYYNNKRLAITPINVCTIMFKIDIDKIKGQYYIPGDTSTNYYTHFRNQKLTVYLTRFTI